MEKFKSLNKNTENKMIESKLTELCDTTAVISSDLKKIINHLGIDRRKSVKDEQPEPTVTSSHAPEPVDNKKLDQIISLTNRILKRKTPAPTFMCCKEQELHHIIARLEELRNRRSLTLEECDQLLNRYWKAVTEGIVGNENSNTLKVTQKIDWVHQSFTAKLDNLPQAVIPAPIPPPAPTKTLTLHEHRHSFSVDFRNSKGIITMVTMIIIIVSLG